MRASFDTAYEGGFPRNTGRTGFTQTYRPGTAHTQASTGSAMAAAAAAGMYGSGIPDAVNTIDRLDILQGSGLIPMGGEDLVQPIPHLLHTLTPVSELPTMTLMQARLDAMHWRMQHALEVRAGHCAMHAHVHAEPARMLVAAMHALPGARGG